MIVIMFATAMVLAMMIFTALALHSEVTRMQSSEGYRQSSAFGPARNG